MTAITYRKRARPLDALIGAGDGILLRVSADAVHERHDGASEKGRKVRKVLRALVAYKQGKKR